MKNKYVVVFGVLLFGVVTFFVGAFLNKNGMLYKASGPEEFSFVDKNITIEEVPNATDLSIPTTTSEVFEEPKTLNDIVDESVMFGVEFLPSSTVVPLPSLLSKKSPWVSFKDERFVLIGKIVSANDYPGSLPLYRYEYTQFGEGSGEYKVFDYFYKTDKGFFLIEKNSNTHISELKDKNGENNPYNESVQSELEYALPLSFPKTLKLDNGHTLKLAYHENLTFDAKDLVFASKAKKRNHLTGYDEQFDLFYKKGLTANAKSIYDRGGFYVRAPDGTLRVYDLQDVGLIGTPKDKKAGFTLSSGEIPENIFYKWTDVGGCGAQNYASVVDIPQTELQQIGTTNFDGTPIYTVKSDNHPLLKIVYTDHYNPWNEEKISYEEFVKKLPLFFWRDKFGRLIKFENEKFLPQAECGKPVIYLYPEKTTDVEVKVFPQGGFSYTEPLYESGWSVVATPESVITNKKDGKTYPYLFWEGKGGIYESPEKGFVVEREKVSDFLSTALSAYGLVAKEISDFKEFWLPKMREYPYYFISFYDNQKMDELAPLKITPEPDSVIRVLMDYKGLREPIKVSGYSIPKRERKGFTVVEWGGVIK